MNMEDIHYNKYIKYKKKYLELNGGMFSSIFKSRTPKATISTTPKATPTAPTATISTEPKAISAPTAPIPLIAQNDIIKMKLDELKDFFKYITTRNTAINVENFINRILSKLNSAYHIYLLLGVPEFISYLETYKLKDKTTPENVDKKYLTREQENNKQLIKNCVNYLIITHAREEYEKQNKTDIESRHLEVNNIFLKLNELINNNLLLYKDYDKNQYTIIYNLKEIENQFNLLPGKFYIITNSFMDIFEIYKNYISRIKNEESISRTSIKLNARFR